MRRKLPVLILALLILLQAFVPAVYAVSENEAVSSNVYLCPFDTTSEGAGKGVDSPAKGIIYKRTDLNTDKEYIGQAKSPERYVVRQKEHARSNPDAEYVFEELGHATPGKELDIFEQNMINKYGGPQSSGGILENRRNQIRQSYWDFFGIK